MKSRLSCEIGNGIKCYIEDATSPHVATWVRYASLQINCRPTMPIFHEHNLAEPLPRDCSFGIRVKLRSTDPFKNLVNSNWTKEHWFATREERDEKLKEMSGRYLYFRPGDRPTLEYEKIDR